MNAFAQSDHPWRWLALWCALLLPLAILVPPIPIDETRYLTAAWEMFNSGQWLVPTVNHAWYSDKSPLLFWLIAGGWKIFGVHTWVARVEALVIAFGMLLALRRLAARLGMDARGADTAMWLLAGALGFAVFSTAIMFDLLLSLTVLGALHALLDLDAGRWKRGIAWLGLMTGLGLLAKGPVMLLAIAGVALLAAVWSDTARSHALRWYLAVVAGLLIGVAILACWLLPAAWYAGPAYWHPLLEKVAGRIDRSFAHGRPWWWYLPVLPVLLLPWLLVLRAPRAAWANVWRGRFGRFVACWWVPPFVAFCAISGKQIHYLLPLLPAWALAGAWLLQQAGARLRPWLFGLLAILAAAGIAALPWLVARAFGYAPPHAVALLAAVALVVAVGAWRAWGRSARGLALSATALLSVALLAATLAMRPAIDVQPAAAFVRQTLRAHIPIVHITWQDGLFGYAGRLEQPLPWITRPQLLPWCLAHPDGIVLVSESHNDPEAGKPFKTWPYFGSRDHRIAAWRAADILATRRAAAASQKHPEPQQSTRARAGERGWSTAAGAGFTLFRVLSPLHV
ncbi:MAG TPA: glycosyltransferase family 39 protein [Rhodanobacteraceae bacterium]|nr:glycosyltransferase family 39 protein [Rhodanobacteraceae bacterium]